MSKQKLNGGDLIVKCLLKEGITKIFGIVGGELLKIYDAIERWGREQGIDTVMVRHEQAAGHAADAWARATGEIGVCMGTAGPGVTHLVAAIAAANADSIPLLVIGAQIARMFDDTGILQGGLNQMKLMEPITKLQVSVEDPYEIPHAVQRCIKTAMSGRRGPVFLELRETALVREASEEDEKKIMAPEKYRSIYRPGANPELIIKALDILKNAKKPMIISGGGVLASEASNELKRLSESYMIPAGTSINGIGTIAKDKKTYLGSYLTSNAFRTAASEADTVISVGCKWDYCLLYGAPPIWNQDQKIIQIDIDPIEIGKNRPAEIGIVGDAKAVLIQLMTELENYLPKEKITEWSEWNEYLQEFHKVDADNIQKMLKSKKVPMKPQRFVYEVLKFIPEDTQIIVDGGDIAVFTYEYINLKPRAPRSVYSSFSMGHLGVGIPYSLGVRLAKPNKPVVCICGDGSFMFNIQELETLVRLNLPIIIVIANNCAWGMIKGVQKNVFDKRFCDVDFPKIDYSQIAKSFGCYGEKVNTPEDLRASMQRAFDSKKTAVIDVDIAFENPPSMNLIRLYKISKGLLGK
jgi:acetolactate synthase-1/2/3 large subunit